nr:MAG TPA: hypothetical protein [Caudoviricetes sp.]
MLFLFVNTFFKKNIKNVFLNNSCVQTGTML